MCRTDAHDFVPLACRGILICRRVCKVMDSKGTRFSTRGFLRGRDGDMLGSETYDMRWRWGGGGGACGGWMVFRG